MFARLSKLLPGSTKRRPAGRRPVPSFVPRLEGLEDRYVPSCTLSVSGSTLTITGDGAANTVRIDDNGNAVSTLSVSCDGVQAIVTGITTIRVNTNGGSDDVTYHLTNGLQTNVARTVDVDLGGDDDVFEADLEGTLRTGSNLTVSADGRTGAEYMRVSAGRPPSGGLGFVFPGTQVNIQSGASLNLDLQGGDSTDNIGVSYRGELDGTLNLLADGNAGLDTVSANVEMLAGSTGNVGSSGNPATVRGGTHDDDLTFVVHNNSGNSTAGVYAHVEGFWGHDVCHRTSNVSVTGCEEDFVVA